MERDYYFFLTKIMSGTARKIMVDIPSRDLPRLEAYLFGIPASQVLKKVNILRGPEYRSERERKDFYRVQIEVEEGALVEWERHMDSRFSDGVPETVNALEEVEKFLKLWEERESRPGAEVASPAS